MLSEDKREIDGVNFRVVQLPCEEQENLLIDLFKVLGPTLGATVGSLLAGKTAGSIKNIADVAIGPGMLAPIVRELTTSLEKDRYHAICKTLARVTQVNTEGDKWPFLKDVQDEVFRGRLPLKWKWLAFALEVQFGFFFSWLGAHRATLAKAMATATASTSPTTSAGPSGG